MPLHPILVHFPVVLALIAPITAVVASIIIWKHEDRRWIWSIAVSLYLILALSSFLAARAGESDEDRVEPYVAESALEVHEEWGEALVISSVVCFLLTLIPLVMKRRHILRLVVALSGIAVLVPAFQAGHSGGKLVYQQGAANAFLATPSPTMVSRHDGDDD